MVVERAMRVGEETAACGTGCSAVVCEEGVATRAVCGARGCRSTAGQIMEIACIDKTSSASIGALR